MYFCLQTNNKVNIFALEIWDDEAEEIKEFYENKKRANENLISQD